jgi:hypothetical protein
MTGMPFWPSKRNPVYSARDKKAREKDITHSTYRYAQ